MNGHLQFRVIMEFGKIENVLKKDVRYFLGFTVIVFIGFVIPTLYYGIPHGTDTYSHMFYTEILQKTNSLAQYYSKLGNEYFTESNYPVGFRLFGSAVLKITGLSAFQLAIIQPLILIYLTSLLYFIYASTWVEPCKNDPRYGWVSVILMLSMPVIAIGILNYETDVFMFPLIILAVTLLKHGDLKRIVILSAMLGLVAVFHAGTYLFLFPFMVFYLIFYSLMYGDVPKAIIPFSVMVVTYPVILSIFPESQPQYGVKSLFILRISNQIAGFTGLDFMRNIGEIVYSDVFSNPNLLYSLYFVIGVYFMSFLIAKASKFIKDKLKEGIHIFPAVALAGIPHTPVYLPFWVGPLQLLLSFAGLKRMDKHLAVLVASLVVVTIPSSFAAGERGLRELQYLFLVIPLLGTLGTIELIDVIKSKVKNIKSRNILVFATFFAIFLSFMTVSAFGNAYYYPKIGIPSSDRTGLEWLSGIGSPQEGVAEIGYGHRISAYAGKISPSAVWIPAGTEMRRYLIDYSRIVIDGDENSAKDMFSSFGAKYLILSDKSLKGLRKTWDEVGLFKSQQYDKIFATKGFVITKFIESSLVLSGTRPSVQLNPHPVVKDAGNFLLVETPVYKFRIGKSYPKIDYFGTKTRNYIEDGNILDYVVLSGIKGEVVQGLEYSKVLLGENVVEYHGKIFEKGKVVATILVRYTFYNESIKKEVLLKNDYYGDKIPARVTTRFYIPYNHFFIEREGGKLINKTIYPNEDYVVLKDLKFTGIFLHGNGKKGIYILYDKTSPYPDRIVYSGSTVHENYSRIDLTVRKDYPRISPSGNLLVTQWLSIGDYSAAKMHVENSSFVGVYPYSGTDKPMILVVKADSLNQSILDRISELKYPVVIALPLYKQTSGMDLLNVYAEKNRWDLAVYAKNTKNTTLKIEEYRKIPELSKKASRPVAAVLDSRPDLEILKLLLNYNISYVFDRYVPPPHLSLFDEGERLPVLATIKGKKENLVLLPVSLPALVNDSINEDANTVKGVIYEAGKNREVVVLEIDGSVFESESAYSKLLEILKFATEDVGFTPVPMENIKDGLLKRDSIMINVSGNYPDNCTITVSSDTSLNGLPLHLKLNPMSPHLIVVDGEKTVRIGRGEGSVTIILTGEKKTSKIIVRSVK